MSKLVALALALLLAGCTVQVVPATTPPSTPTPAPAVTTAAVETATPEPTATGPKVYTDKDFLSDPGLANSREELTKKWPEFAKDHHAKMVCFEMGWTGPVKEKDFITPEIAKRTGFTMIYEPMITNSGEELVTKLNLMVSSGDVPEIFFGGSGEYDRDVYEKLGQTGKIYDMAPYIAKYPLISNLIKPELIKFRYTDAAGDHNWFLPTQTGRGNDLVHNAGGGLYVRKDFLDKLGMDFPTTLDQFITYLRRCRDEIKDVNGMSIIPLLFEENFGGTWNLIKIYMPYANNDGNGFGFNWEDNFKPYDYQFNSSPELKRALVMMNALYTEGLIDKESVAMKREQYSQKISSGRVAAMTAPWWDMNTFSDNAKTDVPDIFYVLSKPLQDPAYPIKYRKWTNWIGCYSTLTFSTMLDEDTINHYCAMMDYFTTLDGQMLVQAGLPGRSFELDASGKYKFTDAFKKETADLDWNKVAATGVYYWQQLVFNLPIFDPLRAEYPELIREDNYAGWLNRKDEMDRYDPSMMPPKDYYFDSGPIERDKKASLNAALDKLVADCILAKDTAAVEALVDAHGAKCKELGIDEVMAERQQIIDNIKID